MSRDDTQGSVRRPRVVARPKVPPGPLHQLKDLLYQLYVAAGPPTLDTIAAWIAADDELAGAPERDTIRRCIGSEDLPANQHDAVAIATVLARVARWDVNDVTTRIRALWVQAAMAIPVGRLLSEVTDPLALEVHRAIDAAAGYGELPMLPPYLERDHDRELQKRVRKAAEGNSTMVVLVGGSSTGKTRACWEAIHKLSQEWRLWHPFDPTRPEAALDTLEKVGPRTVVWLNETQHYLLTGDDRGERIAAGLSTLLTDKDRGPVLVLGTMWPEYWDTLTSRPAPRLPDPHAQARQLLIGTHIVVPDSFPRGIVDSLKIAERIDPRLAEAAMQAEDGEITQYLGGAPALLERYETAPPVARALITAAMDIRRLGYSIALPHALLEAAAPSYLTDTQWDALDEGWLEQALAYTGQSCRGSRGPLTRIRRRPGQLPFDQPRYRLADYLEQIGRRRRHREIIPAQLWQTLVDQTRSPTDAARIGNAAADRLLHCHALPLLRIASGGGGSAWRLVDLLIEQGNSEGLRELADRLTEHGDLESAAVVLHELADAGDADAAELLADLLTKQSDSESLRELADRSTEHGDLESAAAVLHELTDAGDMDDAELPTRLLAERGDSEGLRKQAKAGDAAELLADRLAKQSASEGLRELADAGNPHAAWKLANLLAKRGDSEGLRELADAGNTDAAIRLINLLTERGDRKGLRELADTGNPHAARMLADLLAERGDSKGLRELADTGNPHAARMLADLLAKRGDSEGLRIELLRGNASAGHCLITVVATQNTGVSKRLRQYGLNADGTIPWD